MDILLLLLSIIERKNTLLNVSWYTFTCFIGLIIGSKDETFYLRFQVNQLPWNNNSSIKFFPDNFFLFITLPVFLSTLIN